MNKAHLVVSQNFVFQNRAPKSVRRTYTFLKTSFFESFARPPVVPDGIVCHANKKTPAPTKKRNCCRPQPQGLPIKGSCEFLLPQITTSASMGADVLGWVLIRTIHPAESWQRIPSRPGHSQGVKSLKNFSAKIFLETLPRPLTLTKA